jgi:hypothetical protein
MAVCSLGKWNTWSIELYASDPKSMNYASDHTAIILAIFLKSVSLMQILY